MGVNLVSQWENETTSSAMVEKRVLPSHVLYENIKRHDVGGGINIFDAKVKVSAPISTNMRAHADGEYLAFRILLSGQDLMSSKDFKEPVLTSRERFSLYGKVEPSTIFTPCPNEEIDNIGVTILRKDLLLLTEEEHLSYSIHNFLIKDNHPFGISSRLSPTMRRIFQEIRQNPYSGLTLKLFLQAKAWELLACAFHNIDERKKRSLVGPKEGQIITAVKDLLTANSQQPPSLEELSLLIGFSPRKLNQAFREVYGHTIFEWFNRWKLEEARHILEKNQLPLKEIAFRMGYSHENNFINAFRKEFGISPARYRDENRVKIIAP